MRKLTAHEAKVCFKLYRQGCFGKGHKLIDTVTSGFPTHELDQVKDAIQQLIREGILVKHPTKHGEAVHINPKLSQEMWQVLKAMPDYSWMPK